MEPKIYKGKNLRIFLNEKSIFHSTECTFSTTRSFEGIASKDTQGTVNSPGNYEWSLNSNALFSEKALDNTDQNDFIDVMGKFKSGERVFVQFTTNIFGEVVISGWCYIGGININASTEGVATGDFPFTGDGDFEIGRVPASGALPVISSANVINIENGTGGTFNVVASNTPTAYALSGTIPDGVTINTSTGVVTFTDAVAVGNYLGLNIRVTNASGYTNQAIAIIVTAP